MEHDTNGDVGRDNYREWAKRTPEALSFLTSLSDVAQRGREGTGRSSRHRLSEVMHLYALNGPLVLRREGFVKRSLRNLLGRPPPELPNFRSNVRPDGTARTAPSTPAAFAATPPPAAAAPSSAPAATSAAAAAAPIEPSPAAADAGAAPAVESPPTDDASQQPEAAATGPIASAGRDEGDAATPEGPVPSGGSDATPDDTSSNAVAPPLAVPEKAAAVEATFVPISTNGDATLGKAAMIDKTTAPAAQPPQHGASPKLPPLRVRPGDVQSPSPPPGSKALVE